MTSVLSWLVEGIDMKRSNDNQKIANLENMLLKYSERRNG
jgi:hypothetical protein